MTLNINDLSALIGRPPPANAGNANLGPLLGSLRNAGESGFRRIEENRRNEATVRGQDLEQGRDEERGRSNVAQEYDQKIRRDETGRHHLEQEQAGKERQAEASRANRQAELTAQKRLTFERRKFVTGVVERVDDLLFSTDPNKRAHGRMVFKVAGLEFDSDRSAQEVLETMHEVLRETADPEAMRVKGSIHDPGSKVQGQRLANEMRESDILQDELDPRDDGPRGDYSALGQENVMPGENPQAPLRDERGEPMSPNDVTIAEAPGVPTTPEEAIQRHLGMQVRDQMGEDKKREGQADLEDKLTPDGAGGGLAEGVPGASPMMEGGPEVAGADRQDPAAGGPQENMPDPQQGPRPMQGGGMPVLDTQAMQVPAQRPGIFFEGQRVADEPPSIEEVKARIRKNLPAVLGAREDEGFMDAVVAASEFMDKSDAIKMAVGINEAEHNRWSYGDGDAAKDELVELRKLDIEDRMADRKKDQRAKEAREFRAETKTIRARMNVRGWDENKEGLKKLSHFQKRVMTGNSAEVEDAYRQVMKMSMPGVATDADRRDLTGHMSVLESFRNAVSKGLSGEVVASVRAKMASHIAQMQKLRMRAQMQVYRDFKVSQARAEPYGPRERAYETLDRSEFSEYDSLDSWKEMRRVEKARLSGSWTPGRDENPATRPLSDPDMRTANKADPSANTVSSGIKNLLRKR